MANTRQVTIHVQQAQIPGDLTDFPVLITRLGLPNEMVDPVGANRARTDGGDLRAFVMIAAVKTAIPLEIAEFQYDSASNAGDAFCNIYVKVPSITTLNGADILLEYGDATLTQPAVINALGRNAVWSAAAYVTHDLIKDSTGNTADAIWFGSINSVRTPAGLKAVEMGFTLTGNDTGMIATAFSADQRPISYLATYRYSTNQTVLGYLWTHGANAMQAINGSRRWEYHRKYNGVDQVWRASNAQASGSNWRQQAALHDIDALASPEQYRDETLLALNLTGVPSNPIDALTGNLIIGNDAGGATSWRGGIGPLWVWKSVVSTAFLSTRFRMMSAPATFLSVGTPISIAGAQFLVPALASALVVSVPTLTSQPNTSITFNPRNSFLTLAAPNIAASSATQLALPALVGAPAMQAPALSSQPNTSITFNARGSFLTLTAPTIQAAIAGQFTLPSLTGNVTFALPTIQSQINASLQLGTRASTLSLSTPVIQSAASGQLTMPKVTLSPVLLAPSIQTQATAQFVVPAVASTLVVLPPSIVATSKLPLDAPFVPSSLRIYEIELRDEIAGDGLVGVETNPFQPSIPESLAEAVPLEAATYLQNLSETLHEVYDRIQGGAVVFPAHMLRFVDDAPAFPVGSKARFLHQNLGFISAIYSQFYDTGVPGAPVGLSKFNLERVSTTLADVQSGSLVGVLASVTQPKSAQYAWVITEGRTTLPMVAASDFVVGDLAVWTQTHTVSANLAGPIIGRYRGAGVLVGEMIPAGDIDLRQESNAAGRLLLQLEGINSALSSLAIADENMAALIDEVTVGLDGVLSSVRREIQSRIEGDSATALAVQQLATSLQGQINASILRADQAISTLAGAFTTQIDTARSEFQALVGPVEASLAQVTNTVTTTAAAGAAAAESIQGLYVGLEAANGQLLADASAITSLNATVSQHTTNIATNASGIATNAGLIASQGLTINSQASAITALQGTVNHPTTGLAATFNITTSLQGQITANDNDIAAQALSISSLSATVSNPTTGLAATYNITQTQAVTIGTQTNDINALKAKWSIRVDANNRVNGMVTLGVTSQKSFFDVQADVFRVFNNTADQAVFQVSGGTLFIKGVPLNAAVLAQEGGRLLPLGIGVSQGNALDGVPVNFSTAWSSVPAVVFGIGGKTSDSALGTAQESIHTALNLTTSGFTPSLKLRGIGGTDTSVVDTAGGTSGQLKFIDKTATLPDKSDTYVYSYTVNVNSTQGPNFATVTAYTRATSGGAWVARGSVIHSMPFGANSTFNNTMNVVVSGLTNTADFGLGVVWDDVPSTFTFPSVSYTTSPSVTAITATPAGASPVVFTVIGNKGPI